jgi:hypothetical protein
MATLESLSGGNMVAIAEGKSANSQTGFVPWLFGYLERNNGKLPIDR